MTIFWFQSIFKCGFWFFLFYFRWWILFCSVFREVVRPDCYFYRDVLMWLTWRRRYVKEFHKKSITDLASVSQLASWESLPLFAKHGTHSRLKSWVPKVMGTDGSRHSELESGREMWHFTIPPIPIGRWIERLIINPLVISRIFILKWRENGWWH